MADKKISALTSASTPLAGTEVFPIVQSGSTVKATIANITAGRSIGDNIAVGTTPAAWVAYKSFDIGTQGGIASISSQMQTFQNAVYNGAWAYKADGFAANYNLLSGQHVWQRAASGLAGGAITWIEDGKFDENGNFSVANGNITPATAAKGVNFTANTPAAGMTSQLLNWYEEGAWTPNQGAAVSVVGAYSSSGTYTRVGRLVTATAIQSGATSVATSPSGILFSNLPFTVGGGVARYSGTTALQFSNAAGAIAVGGTTNVYSCGALSGGDTIVTTITYEV